MTGRTQSKRNRTVAVTRNKQRQGRKKATNREKCPPAAGAPSVLCAPVPRHLTL